MKQLLNRKFVYRLLAAMAAGAIISLSSCSDDDTDSFYVDNNTYYDEPYRRIRYVDCMSVETLVNDGISQQTNIVFPQTIYNRLVVNSDSSVQPSAVKVRKIQSAWQ